MELFKVPSINITGKMASDLNNKTIHRKKNSIWLNMSGNT